MSEAAEQESTSSSPWVFYDGVCLSFAVTSVLPSPDSRLQKAAVGVWKALLSGPISLLHSDAAEKGERVASPVEKEDKKR